MEIIRISYFYDHPLQGYGRLDDTNEIVAFMILEDDGWTKLSDISEKYKDLDKTTVPDISELDSDRYHGRNNMNGLLRYFGDEEGIGEGEIIIRHQIAAIVLAYAKERNIANSTKVIEWADRQRSKFTMRLVAMPPQKIGPSVVLYF